MGGVGVGGGRILGSNGYCFLDKQFSSSPAAGTNIIDDNLAESAAAATDPDDTDPACVVVAVKTVRGNAGDGGGAASDLAREAGLSARESLPPQHRPLAGRVRSRRARVPAAGVHVRRGSEPLPAPRSAPRWAAASANLRHGA